MILYPRREFVNRTLDILYPCYSTNQLSGYSFFRDGEACFGTEEYHKSWCRRELFRHCIAANKDYGLQVGESDLQRAFQSFTGSIQPYIDPDSKVGKEITRLIADANEIMESVRLPWKDTKSISKKMPTGSQKPNQNPPLSNDPIGRVTETPAVTGASDPQELAHSSRQKNRTVPKTRSLRAAAPERQHQPTTLCRRSSSTIKLNNVNPLLRRSARLSNSASHGGAPPSTIPISREIAAPNLRVSLFPSTRMSHRRQPSSTTTGKLLPEASSSLNRQSVGNSEGADRIESSPRSDDAYISDLCVDYDYVSDGADSSYSDISTFHIETPYNAVVPAPGASVIEPHLPESLVDLLRRTPLFNISTMTQVYESIQNRASLLRSQFSKRSPQLSFFLPKPSSLPLPQTDGLTLVEQLIQLGERCQWTTQKFEHLWFYERALEEDFFFTLLRVDQTIHCL